MAGLRFPRSCLAPRFGCALAGVFAPRAPLMSSLQGSRQGAVLGGIWRLDAWCVPPTCRVWAGFCARGEPPENKARDPVLGMVAQVARGVMSTPPKRVGARGINTPFFLLSCANKERREKNGLQYIAFFAEWGGTQYGTIPARRHKTVIMGGNPA